MLAPAKVAARKPTKVSPIWMVARNLPGLPHESIDASRAAIAFVDQLLDARPADANERELGGHEQAVEEDEDRDDQDFHRALGYLPVSARPA